ncbi:LysE family translocator [Pseudoalteromonas byunsanensis]|uniref:Lysine transporter LysE n=1 Tax=Pseudoalteromonas byunsanensis TaxID=327939 RepID=A0A1S1N2M1_9GAMM|nr:LysE family translocator [Pseudoalteromonas byunsanensis]OHU93565.1 lysine transporter LysE [Pseudoalteromonas byunsanensis]
MELVLSLALTTALLLGSPGPAPLALAGVGASFGFRQGSGFLAGILGGLLVVIILVAAGLGTLFTAYPTIRMVCQFAAAGYLCFVAYRIAMAEGGIASQTGQPPAFKDGFILNLINPKAYAAFLAIFANNMLQIHSPLIDLLLTASICFLVAVTVDTLWMVAGAKLRPLFARPKQARKLRLGFALALVTSVLFAIAG